MRYEGSLAGGGWEFGKPSSLMKKRHLGRDIPSPCSGPCGVWMFAWRFYVKEANTDGGGQSQVKQRQAPTPGIAVHLLICEMGLAIIVKALESCFFCNLHPRKSILTNTLKYFAPYVSDKETEVQRDLHYLLRVRQTASGPAEQCPMSPVASSAQGITGQIIVV